MIALCVLCSLLTNHTTNSAAEVTVEAAHVAFTTVEVQEATVNNITCAERTAPIVAVTTYEANAAIATVASSREEQCITVEFTCE